MRRKILLAGLLAFLVIAPARTSMGQKRPLTESDLLKLLAGGVYCGRVAMLVRERGIAFSPTMDDLRLLQHAGADEKLERAVLAARRLLPPITISNRRIPQLLPPALSNHLVVASHATVAPSTPLSSSVPTARDLVSLRRTGADLALLNTVERARYFTDQLPGRSYKPRLGQQVAPPTSGNHIKSIPHNTMSSDGLPPTILVASSPSASPSSSSVSPHSGIAVMVRSAAHPKPSIIWHQMHGRWYWHCVAHCSKFRHDHESLSEEASQFYDSSSN
jgi:hypothetical protein